MNYLNKINKKTLKYFEVLEPSFPNWLIKYINTKELLKQQYISVTCGTIYSDLFDNNYFYSSLDHSIAVALIIWHFTHDKKQTLAGLFHDIATPVFKHCIDFLNGDYITQESTEDLTHDILKNSKEIMSLLKEDNILLSEIDNYHIYPIADNDIPRLAADRLEYSLSNALLVHNLLDLNDIKEFYNDITININEDNTPELSFKTKKIARKFVQLTSKLSIMYRDDKTRYSMQLIADIIKELNEENIITKNDLYDLKEKDIIKIIENSKYSKIFNIWRKAKRIHSSNELPKNVYYVKQKAKIRYIDPLVNNKRISNICLISKKCIDKNLKYNMDNYVYLNFKID